jgi:hypothetical protein
VQFTTLDFSPGETLFSDSYIPTKRKSSANGVVAATEPKIPEAINPLDVKSVYANNMEVRSSAFDARINFNEVIVGPTITVECRSNIVMSIDHFKAMIQVLNQHLAKFESAMEAARRCRLRQLRLPSEL